MVIARRVRGRFSVTRLLSRSVRFYFVLSHISLLLRTGTSLRLTLSYSLLIHPFCRLSRRSRRAYSGPSMLSFLPISLLSLSSAPSYPFCFHSLLSVSRVTVLRPYFPPSCPSFSSLSVTRPDDLAPPAYPSYSPLPSLSRAIDLTNHPWLAFLARSSPSPLSLS